MPTVAALMKAERRAGDPGGRAEARAGAVRGHEAQARAGHRRGRRPARSGGVDEARHSGRQRAGRQQQRGRRIRRHRRVDAAAALRLGRRRDQGRQLRQIPRPHGRRQSRRHRGADWSASSASAPSAARWRRRSTASGAKHLLLRSGAGRRGAGASLGARAVSLDELLATSDVVSLHVPLLPATQNLIGATRAFAHEAGRDADPSLARRRSSTRRRWPRACTSGHLGGAAVDVYSTEPPAADNPLLEAVRRGRVAAAADAAHRRRHAAVLGVAVPLRVAERRARAGAAAAAAAPGLLVQSRGRVPMWGLLCRARARNP